MMSNKISIYKVKTYNISDKFPDNLKHLLPRMLEIYSSLFIGSDDFNLERLLKCRGENVVLGLFYGKNMELAGFAIAGIQKTFIGKTKHAIFSAGMYSDLKYNVGQNLAQFALYQSLKYKLFHPSQKLAYLAEALTPAPYSLSSRILPECYPHPTLKTPPYVAQIIKKINQQRNFIAKQGSDFVVNFAFKLITRNYSKLIQSSKAIKCEYYKYYLTINPDFKSGNALLIYMPLSLKNILFGFKNYMKMSLLK